MYLAHETDACVCLLYHDTKAGRHAVEYEGMFSVLGSVHIAATVDQLIGLRRKQDGSRTFFTVGGGDTPETVMGLDAETEKLTALGTAEEVTVGQLKVDILSALEAGDLKRPELLEQVSGKHQLVLKALQQLCDDGKVERTDSGKRGDPYSYALVENNPGIEYSPVTRDSEHQHSFHSAIPTPIGEEGIETIGGGEGSAAIDTPGRKKVEL